MRSAAMLAGMCPILTLAAVAWGAPKEGRDADPVAIVNGEPISRAEFDNALLDRQGVRVLYEMMEESLIRQAAKQAGVEATKKEIGERIAKVVWRKQSEKRVTGMGFEEWLKSNFLSLKRLGELTELEILKEKIVEPTVEVTDKDLEEYWIKYQNRPPITIPERRRISHIAFGFDDYDTAKTVLETVKKRPEKFVELARKHSLDWSSKERGGDLEYLSESRNPDPLLKAAFELTEPGIVDEVVKTRMGYHVVRVDDIKPAVTRKFEDVKDDIRELIYRQRLQGAVRQWTADQMKAAKVQILLKLAEPEEAPAPAEAPGAAAPAPAP